jgi:hypothetical protein
MTSGFGIFRIWRDVGFESVMNSKADVCQDCFVASLLAMMPADLAFCERQQLLLCGMHRKL